MILSSLLVLAGTITFYADHVSSHSYNIKADYNHEEHSKRLSSACLARGRSLTGCPLAPESEPGPFALDEGIVRSNITEGHPGVPMKLDIEVVWSADCEPVVAAAVEIWQCDGEGRYSGFSGDDDDSTFLRGVQFTNGTGFVTFDTIYPSWYEARTSHIHVRVHTGLPQTAGIVTDLKEGVNAHTGQLYFENELGASVTLLPPYNTRTGDQTMNEDDNLFMRDNGADSIVTTSLLGPDLQDGISGFITIGVDVSELSTAMALKLNVFTVLLSSIVLFKII